MIWNINVSYCPIYDSAGTKGSTAANDFAAHRRLSIPRIAGRVIGGSGTGTALTVRSLGQYIGTETHIQSLAELVTHTHPINPPTIDVLNVGIPGGNTFTNGNFTISGFSIGYTGSSSPSTIMQPTTFLNYIIKL